MALFSAIKPIVSINSIAGKTNISSILKNPINTNFASNLFGSSGVLGALPKPTSLPLTTSQLTSLLALLKK